MSQRVQEQPAIRKLREASLCVIMLRTIRVTVEAYHCDMYTQKVELAVRNLSQTRSASRTGYQNPWPSSRSLQWPRMPTKTATGSSRSLEYVKYPIAVACVRIINLLNGIDEIFELGEVGDTWMSPVASGCPALINCRKLPALPEAAAMHEKQRKSPFCKLRGLDGGANAADLWTVQSER